MGERYRFCPHRQRVVPLSAWIELNGQPDNYSETMVAPYVTKPLPVYRSIITGEEIDGRTQHKEHLNVHDVVEVGNERNTASEKPKIDPVAPDIKKAIEQLNSGDIDRSEPEAIDAGAKVIGDTDFGADAAHVIYD